MTPLLKLCKSKVFGVRKYQKKYKKGIACGYHMQKVSKIRPHYIEWIICRCQNLFLQISIMSLFLKNYLIAGLTLTFLIRFSKTKFFPWSTKDTGENDMNKQNTRTHTHTHAHTLTHKPDTQRRITLERFSYYEKIC